MLSWRTLVAGRRPPPRRGTADLEPHAGRRRARAQVDTEGPVVVEATVAKSWGEK